MRGLKVLAALLPAAFPASVLAQSASAQPLWEAGVFGMSVSQQAYPGSDQQLQRNLLLPYLVYRGDWLRVDRGGIELRKVLGKDVELDLGMSASMGSKTDEIEARHGMPELGTLIELGPRIRWTLSRNAASHSQWRAGLGLRSVLDVNDHWRDKGMVLEPQLAYEQRNASGLQWSVGAGLLLGDDRFADTLYGVAAPYQTAQRSAYAAKGGLIATRLTAYLSQAVTPDLRLSAGLRFDSVDGAANQASPLVRQNAGATAGLWLTYTLARSRALAGE